MSFKVIKNNNVLNVSIDNSIDSSNVFEIEDSILASLDGVDKIIIDLEKLQYISSIGTRLLLMLQKRMNKRNGTLIIKNVNNTVKNVLEITGFLDILTIE